MFVYGAQKGFWKFMEESGKSQGISESKICRHPEVIIQFFEVRMFEFISLSYYRLVHYFGTHATFPLDLKNRNSDEDLYEYSVERISKIGLHTFYEEKQVVGRLQSPSLIMSSYQQYRKLY